MTVESYLHQGKMLISRWAGDKRLRRVGEVMLPAGAGFVLSAASLGNFPQPFAMALIGNTGSWRAVVMLLFSALGYRFFWGAAGTLGVAWSMLGGLTALLGRTKLCRASPWTVPALCCLWTAASGLVWLLTNRDISTLNYLLGIALAGGSARVFSLAEERRDPAAVWVCQGIAVLALAQVGPLPWLNLGYMAAGMLALSAGVPAAVLAGLALDLSQISPVPMTAVVCLIWLTRLIPGLPKGVRRVVPGPAYLLVMYCSGWQDFNPLPGFVMGGLCSALLRERREFSHRRGQTGYLQVRLELMAGVLSQTRQLLMEFSQPPVDEQALLIQARERACSICPNRKSCARLGEIPVQMLHRPWTENTSLPFPCKKPGRMILELRRCQEHYRRLQADRARQQEYRRAVIQQYGFLSDYLQELSDGLPRQAREKVIRFRPVAAVASRSREVDNGDKCVHFQGPGNQYFLLLCDGMGTGLGASREGSETLHLLRQMLSAGFPAAYALESLNSMLSLRGRAGAVTVDLVQILLDTGRASVYKWGAAPSYLLRGNATEKIGTAGPPPGIGVGDTRLDVQRLSLRRGETLIIASDGVDGEELRRCAVVAPGLAAGEMAAQLLEVSAADSEDDATVAVVRLHPAALST